MKRKTKQEKGVENSSSTGRRSRDLVDTWEGLLSDVEAEEEYAVKERDQFDKRHWVCNGNYITVSKPRWLRHTGLCAQFTKPEGLFVLSYLSPDYPDFPWPDDYNEDEPNRFECASFEYLLEQVLDDYGVRGVREKALSDGAVRYVEPALLAAFRRLQTYVNEKVSSLEKLEQHRCEEDYLLAHGEKMFWLKDEEELAEKGVEGDAENLEENYIDPREFFGVTTETLIDADTKYFGPLVKGRAAALLKKAGVQTFGELTLRNPKELLKIKGFSRKALERIQDNLSYRGLWLGMSKEDWPIVFRVEKQGK